MTWQDELRRLDEELASGRLSAEEYRQLRDALLGTTAQPPSTPVTGDDAEEATQRSSPFPPPFRWDQQSAEATHVMPPVMGDPGAGTVPRGGKTAKNGDDAERTQVVPERPAGDAERTQVVPGQPGPAHPEAMFPNYGQQPAGQTAAPWQPGPANAPPWATPDSMPQTSMPPAWLRQGPEDFEVEPGRSRKWRVLGVFGAVVLLAGISVGAYYLFRPAATGTGPQGTTSAVANPTTTTPPPPTTTEPAGPPIADLPGKIRDTSGVKTFPDVEQLRYLTADEIGAYRSGGAGEAKMGFARDGDQEIIILVIKQQDAATAVRVRDELGALQLSYNLAAVNAQPGVLAAATDAPGAGPLRRAHYASNGYVVRVEVKGPNAAQADQTFTEILGAQLDELPADA